MLIGHSIALVLHTLAAVVWVGGMFFAYMVLRPAAGVLQPPQRLALWAGVFKKFFPWVWMSVMILLLSGYWMIGAYYGGFSNSGVHIHSMQALGLLMLLLFCYLYYRPLRRFNQTVAAEDWPAAAAQLSQIRGLIVTNLGLGLIVVVIAVAGSRGAFVAVG